MYLKQNTYVYKGIQTYNLLYTTGFLGGVINTRDSQTQYTMHPSRMLQHYKKAASNMTQFNAVFNAV
jgi:hypothetical protein